MMKKQRLAEQLASYVDLDIIIQDNWLNMDQFKSPRYAIAALPDYRLPLRLIYQITKQNATFT